MCLEKIENCVHLNPRVFANNNMKLGLQALHYVGCQFWLS